jgi:predicted nucleic acid-binding protein
VKLYLDANVIIYGYEASEPIRSAVRSRLWQWCVDEDGKLVTSAFSRLECRVVPLRHQNQVLLAAYDGFFNGGEVEIIDVSIAVIDLAAELRAKYAFKAPDAVHLASAIQAGAQVFLTADAQLRRCSNIAVEVIQPL